MYDIRKRAQVKGNPKSKASKRSLLVRMFPWTT
jgi:hypothetical protein